MNMQTRSSNQHLSSKIHMNMTINPRLNIQSQRSTWIWKLKCWIIILLLQLTWLCKQKHQNHNLFLDLTRFSQRRQPKQDFTSWNTNLCKQEQETTHLCKQNYQNQSFTSWIYMIKHQRTWKQSLFQESTFLCFKFENQTMFMQVYASFHENK